MGRAISLVVPDAGPLISLAMADKLDLLEAFAVPIATLDVVKAECLFKEWPGRERLDKWFGSNVGRIEIIASPLFAVYQAAVEAERNGTHPSATRGLGDAAIAWFVANAPFMRRPNTTLLVLTEDAALGDSVLGRDVHVLSTRAFLQTLENLDMIRSAREILDEIEQSGRKVAPYSARIGPRWSVQVVSRKLAGRHRSRVTRTSPFDRFYLSLHGSAVLILGRSSYL